MGDFRKPFNQDFTGSYIFSIGRLADIGLQYWVLENGAKILNGFDVATLPLEPATKTVLLSAVAIAALRQNYWCWVNNLYELPAPLATGIVVFNSIFNAIPSLIALQTSPKLDQPIVLVGLGLFALGSFLETYSEIQRTAFKKNPLNKGKAYTGGLFSFVQHVNYLGYAIWRSGMFLIAGSWAGAVATFTLNISQFAFTQIPGMQKSNEKKYGQEWRDYSARTPKLIPFIW